MKFSLNDYLEILSTEGYNPPNIFTPYIKVCRVEYSKLAEEFNKTHFDDFDGLLKKLRARVGNDYQNKVARLQSRVLDASRISFPAYGFILHEVITDDWLAIVDWHKFQRDHALHQPLCAYISQKIQEFTISHRSLIDICIDEILKWQDTRYLFEYIRRNFDHRTADYLIGDHEYSREIWKLIFSETLYIASLFHDLGYPWQYINTLNSKLKHAGYNKSKPLQDALNIIDAFGRRPLFFPLNGYRYLDDNASSTWKDHLIELVATSLQDTHGFPGAIGFLYLNDVISQVPNGNTASISRLCIEWAAMSIMMHDMGKIYRGDMKKGPSPAYPHLKLKINKDPLSCILTLIDTLEEFERPSVIFTPYNRGSVSRYNAACVETVLNWDRITNELKITYKYEKPEHFNTKLSFIRGHEAELFDPNTGYLDLSAVGIRKVTLHAELIDKNSK